MDVLEWISYAAGNVPRLEKQCFGREQQVELGGQGKAFPLFRTNPLPTSRHESRGK